MGPDGGTHMQGQDHLLCVPRIFTYRERERDLKRVLDAFSGFVALVDRPDSSRLAT